MLSLSAHCFSELVRIWRWPQRYLCENAARLAQHGLQIPPDGLSLFVNDYRPAPIPGHISIPSRRCWYQGVRVYVHETLGPFPSVTTILDDVGKGSFRLRAWRRQRIEELGEVQFASMMSNYRNRGQAFHKRIERHFLHGSDDIPESDAETDGFWASIQHVLNDIDGIAALESAVFHPLLGYSGTFDGVVRYQGRWVLVDWKTSSVSRRSLADCFDYPSQVVAYMAALNADPIYPFHVTEALIVVAYHDGEDANVHRIEKPACEEHWSAWLGCLAKYCDRSVSPGRFRLGRLPLVWHRPKNLKVLLSNQDPEIERLAAPLPNKWELYEDKMALDPVEDALSELVPLQKVRLCHTQEPCLKYAAEELYEMWKTTRAERNCRQAGFSKDLLSDDESDFHQENESCDLDEDREDVDIWDGFIKP